MKAVKRSLVVAAALLGVFAGSARAQDIVTAKVPFPFIVSHQTLPAGEYSIRTVDGRVTVIRGMDRTRGQGSLGLTLAAGGSGPLSDQPALVFTAYETGWRLSQVWLSEEVGREFPGTAIPRRTAQSESLAGTSGAEVYVLAANWK